MSRLRLLKRNLANSYWSQLMSLTGGSIRETEELAKALSFFAACSKYTPEQIINMSLALSADRVSFSKEE